MYPLFPCLMRSFQYPTKKVITCRFSCSNHSLLQSSSHPQLLSFHFPYCIPCFITVFEYNLGYISLSDLFTIQISSQNFILLPEYDTFLKPLSFSFIAKTPQQKYTKVLCSIFSRFTASTLSKCNTEWSFPFLECTQLM